MQAFQDNENTRIKELKEKFNEYIKLKDGVPTKRKITLTDVIFNDSPLNLEFDNFIPIESKCSKSLILYIKINEIDNEKYIVIDKYDKYIEERKYIELNLIKAINYQYLHTLYHELNNPLNALLAISGENERTQIFASEINNSKFEKKPSLTRKKSVSKKLNSKIEKNVCCNNDRLRLSQDIYLDNKSRKRTLVENSELNNKIPLLVNIIRIFIKNLILYLKTRADNLMMLKNEFNMRHETSDIMNAVEVSEYEKELTRHKPVKINLEYIFDLYFEKFLCLFKYKEIEYETNFDRLRNYYIITDEFNFTYYIRQIYTYLYYVIQKREGFCFDYKEDSDNNFLKIFIKKKKNAYISKRTGEFSSFILKDNKNNKDNKDHKSELSQVIQTKEMTKEVL